MSAYQVHALPVQSIAAPSLVRFSTGHDKESLAQLAASIKRQGLIQPIVVRPYESTEDDTPAPGIQWLIVAGRRRLAAFKLAGLTEIPALISGTDEAQAYEAEAAENLQREDMSLLEKATYIRTLMTVYNDQKKVREIVCKSPAWVSKMLTITDSKTPLEVKDLLDRGLVTDLETLLLLKQIAQAPGQALKRELSLRRMLKLAQDGNLTRVHARDELARLKAPADKPAPTTTTSTTTSSSSEQRTIIEPDDPLTVFTAELPIELLEVCERHASAQEKTISQWLADLIRSNSESGGATA
jgi:ParB/RepB/Spo0J family partition protein